MPRESSGVAWSAVILGAALGAGAFALLARRGRPQGSEPAGSSPGLPAPSWTPPWSEGPPMAATAMANVWRLPLSAQPLSPIRKSALSALKDILPAKNGGGGTLQANADAIGPTSPKEIADIQAKVPHFSNCGSLPGWLSRALSLKDGGTQYGTEGVRTRAKARGAWVDAEPGLPTLPKPGDIYALSSGPRGAISHVGIVIDIVRNPDGTYTLETADAGQGIFPQWEAKYVKRGLLIDGPKAESAYKLPARYIVGWLDLDKWESGPDNAVKGPLPPSVLDTLISDQPSTKGRPF